MEQLKMMKENIMACIQTQMGRLDEVNTEELGEAIDMIKDLSEAIYYCTITEAMKEKEKESKDVYYYTEREIPMDFARDYREGNSPMQRRMYMESKEMHHNKEVQIKELEKYLKELTSDITEMVKDATPEEKRMLQNKLTALATKLNA